VVLHAGNSLEYLLAGAAARAVGGVPVPMNHRLTAPEVAYILADADATAVFVGDQFLPVAEAVRPGAGKVREWILIGAERRPWARHLDDLVAAGSPAPYPVNAASLGASMIYTAGTTGKPKGALRRAADPAAALPTRTGASACTPPSSRAPARR
jgi:acyl-CoA synthetase (AMP-forming)/AMP-acid ligase II